MLRFSDSKTMAKVLRKALAERRIDITHSDSLELVARQFGFANWNMLSARIEGEVAAPVLPTGWRHTGQASVAHYRVGLDPEVADTIKIEAKDNTRPADAFGGVMQSILADDYRGRTIRARAELRGRGVDRGALWMRVDGETGRPPLAFDNMMERHENGAIHGDADWVERSIVLVVPEIAGSIHYGVLLAGGGELWARNFSVDEVDPDAVAITAPTMPRRPNNLGFGV